MNPDSLQPSASHCPACCGTALKPFAADAHDARPGQRSTVSIIECLSCGWAWQYPFARDVADSQATFADAYKTAATDSYFDPVKRTAVARFQRDFVIDEFKPRTLLDIGCGDGAFVTAMAEEGCAAWGLDPSLPEEKVTVASKTGWGLTLSREGLEDLPAGLTFDVVTLWDVIEHVPDPLSLVRNASQRLSPGGWLVVETGNYQSRGRAEAGTGWWGFQLDHRWYFAPPQLRNILDTCGLDSIRLIEQVLRPWWNGSAGSRAPALGTLLRASIKRPHRAPEFLVRQLEQSRVTRKWPQWSGLEIMTMVARRRP